jgi:uncharacterized membrane protein
MFKIFLAIHIFAGTVGLVIGPISMFTPKRKGLHTKVGTLYFYLMAMVCLSAVILAILHWEASWWFVLVAAFSFSFALRGYRAASSIPPFVFWILPSLVGVPMILMTTRRYVARG